MPLEISNIPVISISHITQEVSEALSTSPDDMWTLSASYPYGFFLYMQEDIDSLPEDTPQCLIDLYRWAQEQHFSWIRLDQDADVVQELPVYDW